MPELLSQPLAPQAAARDAALARECDALCRHLIGVAPTPYVRAKYAEAHARGRPGPVLESGAFDALLVALAARGGACTRLADAYAAVFDRGGTLRRKLVLLLAILESSGDTSALVDTPTPGSRAGFAAALLLRGLTFAATVLVAAALLLPLRLALALTGGAR